MATSYIYNALKGLNPDGSYETRQNPFTNETEFGVTLYYGGNPWWFPYGKVTPIPNFALCEVDHDKSTPEKGLSGRVIYKNEFLSGEAIAHELTETQVPFTNAAKGIQVIQGKSTGKELTVFAGISAEAANSRINDVRDPITPIMATVIEREATKPEIERAEAAALAYKKQMIADYFDSKRQRMTGGQGKHTPDKITRVYMDELNVEDMDDVTAHQKAQGGMTPEALSALVKAIYEGQEINGATLLQAVETVRKKGKATLSSNQTGRRRQSLGLAANKAKYKEEHPDDEGGGVAVAKES